MFRSNPHYVRFVDLLLRLHLLMKQGQEESVEANDIRESMDAPWDGLSPLEIDRVRGLSADLYTLEPESPIRHPESGGILDEAVRQELGGLLEECNWTAILRCLRDKSNAISADLAAYLRGRCWVELGDLDAGILFLTYAAEMQHNFAPSLIVPVLQSGDVQRAANLARELVTSKSRLSVYPSFVLANACCLLVDRDTSHADSWYQRAVDVFEFAFKTAADLQARGDSIQLLPGNFVALALCYDAIHETEKARDAIDKALKLDSENPQAMMLHAWVNRQTTSNREFQKGMEALVIPSTRSAPSVNQATCWLPDVTSAYSLAGA